MKQYGEKNYFYSQAPANNIQRLFLNSEPDSFLKNIVFRVNILFVK